MSKVVALYQTEKAIIEGVKNFEDAAATILYNKHKDYCIRFTARMYDDTETIQDIYQDAVIVLIENIRHKNLILENTSIQTYLNSICRNQVLSRVKSSKKMKYITNDDIENSFDEKIDDWLDDLNSLKSERLIIISEELLKMKDDGGKCYDLLALFYFESRTMDYIAQKLEYTNADNAKNQKSRCQKRLKEQVFNRIQ